MNKYLKINKMSGGGGNKKTEKMGLLYDESNVRKVILSKDGNHSTVTEVVLGSKADKEYRKLGL